MLLTKTRYTIIALLFFISSHLHAKQVSFNKVDVGDSYQFNYQWLDINETEQSLSFILAKKGLFSPFRQFKEYRPAFAEKYVKQQLIKSLRETPLRNVMIDFGNNTSSARLTSPDQEALSKAQQRIEEEEQKFFDDYLTKKFYHQFTTHDFEQGIKPDHVRIAKESVALFEQTKDTILEIVNVRNIRRVTNYVLGFVQSIPYSTLNSRLSSSGAGFNVPAKVLWENQGDCDSKMTLTASMLRSLMPRLPMAMIYIDQHAFIGLGILPQPGDVTIQRNGTTFVLADPTGPLKMPLGKLSFDSEQAIKSGLFSAEIYE